MALSPNRDPLPPPREDLLPLFVRIAVGGVFLVSGVVKFLFENQGAGRFAKLGFPPGVSTFVGVVEIVGGLLLMAGLFTRIAAGTLAVDMLVAIVTTKLPFWHGTPPEPVAAMPKAGFWAFAYQARLDLVLLLCCVGLALAGAGARSIDARRRRDTTP